MARKFKTTRIRVPLRRKEVTARVLKEKAYDEKEYQKKYREKNREKLIEAKRKHYQENKEMYAKKRERWAKENPEKMKKAREKYSKNNPEKKKAKDKARWNIKFDKDQMCVFCEGRKAKEMHHPDYSKPLEVMFLCIQCHRSLHIIQRRFKEEVSKVIDEIEVNIDDGFHPKEKYCNSQELKQKLKIGGKR